MAEAETVEERLTALEHEIAELKRRLGAPAAPANWRQQVQGSFKDEPAFDEVLRLGREIRQSDQPDTYL